MEHRPPFSERERQVIEQLVQGKSNKEIALALDVSRRTVEFHLSNIYSKLGVTSRTEAALKLSKPDLRDSTGPLPVESTVEKQGDSIENGATPILRRMPVKHLYPILGGLLVILLAAWIIFEKPPQHPAPGAQTPVALTPVSNLFSQAPSATPEELATVTLPAPAEIDLPEDAAIPPHTVNDFTAQIESYYVDTSHVIFQVRITGGEITFGDEHYYGRIAHPELYDENGNVINTSGGFGPAVDPELIEFHFVPTTLLKGDRFKGQFAFDISNAPAYNETLAQFRFDVDLPTYPERRFYPKQSVSANGLEMFLDSVTVTPVFTQAYVCFPPPSFDPWHIGSDTDLQLDAREASLHNFNLLFASDLGGDRRAGSEPYWAPPTKNGRCIKIGFPIGSSNPDSLTLTIPGLENLDPHMLLTDQLLTDYPGLTPREAYATYLEEHDRVYKGPWIFQVELEP